MTMRITIRFNETEELRLKELRTLMHEDDLSKVVKFAVDTALHHIKVVTGTLVMPEWEVIFTRKRKTMPLDRKLY